MTATPKRRVRVTKATEPESVAKTTRLEDIQPAEVSVVDRAANKRTFVVVKAAEPESASPESPVDELLALLSKALALPKDDQSAALLEAARAIAKRAGHDLVEQTQVEQVEKDVATSRADARSRIDSIAKGLDLALKMHEIDAPAPVVKATPATEAAVFGVMLNDALARLTAKFDELGKATSAQIVEMTKRLNSFGSTSHVASVAGSSKIPVEEGTSPSSTSKFTWPRDMAAEGD